MSDKRHGARPPHVLTVVHSLERTGPPLVALRFLRWLREQRPDWVLSTLSLGGGDDLAGDFGRLGDVLEGTPVDPTGRLRRRARAELANRALAARLRRFGAVDLVHVHCAGSMRALDVTPRAPVLAHLHELSVGLELHLGRRARHHLAAADRYVAVADVVRDQFLERFPVDPDKVERQWGFVDPGDLPGPTAKQDVGLPANCTLVVASGVRHWRKAPELFVRVARAAVEREPDRDWRFVWVGGSDVGGLEDLVQRAGLGDRVQFLGHRPDSLRWIAAADLFFLPAREDAFPLVCVEAAALGRPIVSFDNGGTAELVERSGGGVVVPFPDVAGAATTICELAAAPEAAQRLGAAGAQFARAHLTTEHAAPLLLAALERTLAPPSGQ